MRDNFRKELKGLGWKVDPAVWRVEWGVGIHAFGTGENAVKYLGTYVARSAIADGRILSMTEESVTFTWKDRSQGGRKKLQTLPGTEFVQRYLRHVLPRGLRAIRYFGFCHPSAKNTRLKIQAQSGQMSVVDPDASATPEKEEEDFYQCPNCGGQMEPTFSMNRKGEITFFNKRGPPQLDTPEEVAAR